MASQLGVHRAPAAATNTAHCRRSSVPNRLQCKASVKGSKQPNQQQESASSSVPEAPVQPITREFTALGSKVVESNVAFQGPEDQPDFWEGDNFEAFGKTLENYFMPALIVLGLVCGGIAAKTYNEGATEFVKPPTGPDAEPIILKASPEGEPIIIAPSVFSE